MQSECVLNSLKRGSGRSFNELRPLRVTYNIFPYAAGSVLFEQGHTKILCAVTMQQSVPHFLRGSKTGWLTTEYSMLPAATQTRTPRESTTSKRHGRSVEISRLIGRSLRSVVNLAALGEHTLHIDCDVLQADAGTRTAAINAASLALEAAQERLLRQRSIVTPFLKERLAAVSVVALPEGILLDPDYAEDSRAIADVNFVLTHSGGVVEMQGCSERGPLAWHEYAAMYQLARSGTAEIFMFFDQNFCDPSLFLGQEHIVVKRYESNDIS